VETELREVVENDAGRAPGPGQGGGGAAGAGGGGRGRSQGGNHHPERVVAGHARKQPVDPARDLELGAAGRSPRPEVEAGGIQLDRAGVLAPVQVHAVPGVEGGQAALMARFHRGLVLAGDDAARREQTEIRPDNLLIGIFRATPSLTMGAMRRAKVDIDLLRAEIGARVLPPDERVQRGKLLLGSAAQEVMRAAIAFVKRRKQETVQTAHLLRALCDADHPFLAELLHRCGSGVVELRDQLDGIL